MAACLRDVFGLPSLRPGQDAVIRSVMQGRHTLAVMATGAGKSLCYQVPALLLPGVTVVVSPLIALMQDQCDKLRALGVAVVQLHSAVGAAERRAAEQALADGDAKIVLTTPEHLADPAFQALLARRPVSLLVVDEVHCLAEWGHDFRPAFQEIGSARRRLGRPVVLALTATATPATADDVADLLGLQPREAGDARSSAALQLIHTGVYRPNLALSVEHAPDEAARLARLLTLVAAQDGQGLVYTATVKAAEAVRQTLQQNGQSVTLYHGRLAAGERRRAQAAYMSGAARVLVATKAFGLGIDKPDTRFVIHYQLPATPDAYYQEAGRAGRDGAPAQCCLLYQGRDRAVQQFFLVGRYPTADDVQAVHARLQADAPPGGWQQDVLLQAVAEATHRPKKKLQLALLLLRRERVVVRDAEGRLSLVRSGLQPDELHALTERYAERRARDHDLLEAMVFYCLSGRCRWKLLLDHFGEGEDFERCGRCDNCAQAAVAQAHAVAAEVAQVTHENQVRDHAHAASTGAPAASAAAPARRPDLAVGDAVRVPRYGRGNVVALDALSVTVGFPHGPQRSFLPQVVHRA